MQKLKTLYQYRSLLWKENLLLPKIKKIKRDVYRHSLLKTTVIENNMFFILYIRTSLTNTRVTLTNSRGRVLVNATCGRFGFTTKKKCKSKYAINYTLANVLSRIKDFKLKHGLLFLNGFTKIGYFALDFLKEKKVKIIGIRNITPLPHNGCRPRKKRRV